MSNASISLDRGRRSRRSRYSFHSGKAPDFVSRSGGSSSPGPSIKEGPESPDSDTRFKDAMQRELAATALKLLTPAIQEAVSRSSNEEREQEYLDDDSEWLENTRDVTSKEDVMQMKANVIAERNRADRAEMAATRAACALQVAEDEKLRAIKRENEAYTQGHQRGKPEPPSPDPEQDHHYLYQNVIDKLRESTVHIFLRRSQNHYMMHSFRSCRGLCHSGGNTRQFLKV